MEILMYFRNTFKNFVIHKNPFWWSKYFILTITLILAVSIVIILIRPASAAVAYVSSTIGDNGAGSTSLTISNASTNSNQLLVAFVSLNGSSTITAPAGWVEINTQTFGSSTRGSVFYRVQALSGEPTSYNFTLSATVKATAVMAAYSGVDLVNPVDAHSNSTTSSGATTMTAQSVTTTVPNAMLVAMYGKAQGTTFTAGSSMTLRGQSTSSGGGNAGTKQTSGLQDILQASAGASGTKTMTAASGTGSGTTHLVALRPAPVVSQVGYRWFASAVNDSGVFDTRSEFTAGDSPKDVLTADFNEDGTMDIATANVFSNNVSILIGSGSGSFATKVDYSTGTNPNAILSDDFNEDGFEDIITTSPANNTISILIGNGDGTFDPKVDYGAGSVPYWTTSADFNGDGFLDVGVANSSSSSVSILIGNGDGTFDPKVDYGVDGTPRFLLSNDFNEDNVQDIISFSNTNPGSMTLLTGNGNGTFATGVNYTTNVSPTFAITNDFNVDGFADLAVTFGSFNLGVSVYLGNGDGTFDPNVDYATGDARSITGQDVNSDNFIDLITANNSGSTISVSTGNGNGTFNTSVSFASGSGGSSITTSDFNGDNIYDLLYSIQSDDKAAVALGVGAPTTPLAAASTPATGVGPGSLIRLDMNLGVTESSLVPGASYKLRYMLKSGTCSTTPSAYSDVTTSSAIKFYDNSSVSDGSKYGFSALSPKRSGVPVINQTYEESNPFTSINSVPASQDGLWEFGLAVDTAAAPGTYCFIATTNSDGALDSYTTIPEITVAEPTVTQASYKWYANSNSSIPGAQLVAQDTAASIAPETPFRLRQRLAVDSAELSASAKNFKLQYAEKSGVCDVGFSGEIYTDMVVSATGSQTRVAGTVSNDASSGTLAWGNPDSAAADDGVEASRGFRNDPGGTTNYLASSNHNFSIPVNATINGVTLTIDRRHVVPAFPASGNVTETEIKLIKAGSIQSTNRSAGSTWDNFASGPKGGSTDLWGTTWTPSDINNAGFGAAIQASINGDNTNITTAYVDSMSIKVDYSLPGTAGPLSYYDNASPVSGAAITSSGNDPINGARATVYQTYQETDPFTNSAVIPAGSDGLWDFSLTTSSAAIGKTYCLRTVKSNGALLDTYSQIPEFTVQSSGGGPSLDQMTRGGQSVIDGIKNIFSW